MRTSPPAIPPLASLRGLLLTALLLAAGWALVRGQPRLAAVAVLGLAALAVAGRFDRANEPRPAHPPTRDDGAVTVRDRGGRRAALGDGIPGAMVFVAEQAPTGAARLTEVGGDVQGLYGVTARQALADPAALERRLSADDRRRCAEALERSRVTMRPLDVQLRRRGPDGEWRWSRRRAAPRRLADGRIVWDGVEMDITDLKNVENALRAALAAARRDPLGAFSPPPAAGTPG